MKNAAKTLFLVVLVFLPLACGGSKEKRLAANLEALNIANLQSSQIKITSFDPAGKNEAVLEADVHTTFLMKKNSRGLWEIESIRVGDRRWVDARLLMTALDQVKARQVQDDFEKLTEAIERFRAKNHQLPAANGMGELLDLLYPTFSPQNLRLDPWSTEYSFHLNSAGSYTLISAGPDRKFGTADDIRLEK
jgi:hypothetical protein